MHENYTRKKGANISYYATSIKQRRNTAVSTWLMSWFLAANGLYLADTGDGDRRATINAASFSDLHQDN